MIQNRNKWILFSSDLLCLYFFQILNNLLEIVKDRAEAAEDELERLITEINENQDSSSISSEKSGESSAPSPVSTGSDDVFDGSPAEKTQIAAFWEVSPTFGVVNASD